ncbi:MAG: glycosyltransferase family 39 protein [Hyphomonadaceae bacterium]|nr:glycosyltransferase family 39 protein [Hyphomonadaceae bacterium]
MASGAALDPLDALSRGWRAWALIAALTIAAALPGFSRIPALDRDEARFAQATRQMVETGDFVRIRLQDEARTQKPIGIYWLQAATVSVSGAPLNAIWGYRLASLLGALLAAFAAFWAGLALLDRRTAFLGAALFAPGMLIAAESAIAKTDALLCGLVALALAALAHLRHGGDRRLALLFWAALAAGVLTKGPAAPLVCGLTIAALAAWERRIAWLAPLAHWTGPALGALIIAPWAIAISAASDGAFFQAMIGGDLAPKITGGQQGHGAPPGYHLVLLAPLLIPATLGLAQAVRLGVGAARRPRDDAAQAGVRFLVCWIAPTFLFFEAMPTKLAHYTLPTFPALALVCAAGLIAGAERRWRLTAAASWVWFAAGGAALIAVTAYVSTFMPGDADADRRRAVQIALIGAAVLIASLALMARARTPIVRAGAAIAFALFSSWHLRERILPEAREVWVSREAALALRRAGLADRPLIVVGYREISLAFETETRTQLLPFDQGAAAIARAPRGAALLLHCDLDTGSPRIAMPPYGPIGGEAITGLNYSNGDRVCLVPRVAD